MIPINYMAVFAAAVSSMFIGFLWYGPLFGKAWIKLSGMTEEALKTSKTKGMAMQYSLMFAGSLLMAYVLAHALVFASTYTSTFGVAAGLMGGFWNWLGFILPVTLSAVLWEKKSWGYWFLNVSYYLVMLSVMAVILALWK